MDPFDGAIERTEELRGFYEPAMERALRKDIARLDEMCRRLIAAAPMLFVASVSADGRIDVTPRGGRPGFVTVLDEKRLAIPDAAGNRRLDTLENVVATGRIGLIFVIPGRDTTLRVNGRACVSAHPALLDRLTPVGKRPRTAIVVEAEEVSRTARRRSFARGCGTRTRGPIPPRSPRPRRCPSLTSAIRSSRSRTWSAASARRSFTGSTDQAPSARPISLSITRSGSTRASRARTFASVPTT